MPEFIPGLLLNQAFYWEAVRPILDSQFPGLAHSAALIGWGSDVLGLDTPASRDHGWGPRLVLFLDPSHFEAERPAIYEALCQRLPVRFRGYSTHYSQPDPGDNGTQATRDLEHGPVNPMIPIDTIDRFWKASLGVGAYQALTPRHWLTFQEQSLLSLTAGKVYFDGLGLEVVRRRFAYYPRDVWVYLLAAQWQLISQEEAFVGRAHSVGDEVGSRVIAARLVHQIMGLCFLYEKRYAPYSKWFGTVFKQLACYSRMGPLLEGVLTAGDYPQREASLAAAYTLSVKLLNGLDLCPPLDSRTRTYSAWHALRGGVAELPLDDPRNTRPHQVIFAGRIADALYAALDRPQDFPPLPLLGSVNTFMVPSSDALQNGFITRLWQSRLSGPDSETGHPPD